MHEMFFNFTEKLEKKDYAYFLRSINPIPAVASFRYLEVEVIDNPSDVAIWVGIMGEDDLFKSRMKNPESELTGDDTLIINGKTGQYHNNRSGRDFGGFTMLEMGNNIGFCMHMQSPDE